MDGGDSVPDDTSFQGKSGGRNAREYRFRCAQGRSGCLVSALPPYDHFFNLDILDPSRGHGQGIPGENGEIRQFSRFNGTLGLFIEGLPGPLRFRGQQSGSPLFEPRGQGDSAFREP